jgi:putative nucleotidyltransferase with HDIG domain
MNEETTLNAMTRYNKQPLYDTEGQAPGLSTIAAALGIKDPYTREHNRRVAIYARRLAECIGLRARTVENIQLGGLLHDIGKIGLSAKVLNNTHDQLSGDMMAEVHLHPLMGAAILKNLDVPAPVIDYVRFHHERMDGSGYPFGLRNNQIPLGAKIIRVADCFDAITTDRPYQQRKNWIEALAVLRQISGTDLNPSLVAAFIADIKENGLALNPIRSISLYRPVSQYPF